ncbi:lysM and putative peptidoglycan-binding domain-containing protein 1-like isoform X1 [Crassostrea virginica]
MMKSLEMITMCARSRDILPSKMADGSGGTESQLLGKFMEKQTKYGTTTRLVTKSSIAAKHKVCQSDTLMGIALKYGSTVEQIKRENQLWTNDSLFLREYLLIPIACENEHDLPKDCEIIEIDNTLRSRSSSSGKTSRSNSQVNGSDNENSIKTETKSTSNSVETKEASGKDFLSKFDNSFAVLKSNVKKMEQNKSFLDDHSNNALPHLPVTSTTSSSNNSRTLSFDGYQNTGYQSTASPVLQIKSRKVQASVSHRLEEESDELFQL